MQPWYIDRDSLKSALTIRASSTGDHLALDLVLDAVSRSVEDFCKLQFYPSSATLDFTAENASSLNLKRPILAVDAIQLDSDGDTTYESTMSTGSFWLAPYNARQETPRRPYWEIETTPNTTAVFTAGVRRGVRVQGTWGYFDERIVTPATLATGITSGATSIQLNGASAVHPGQLLLMDSERLIVTGGVSSATGVHTSTITVERAAAGTAAAAHTSGAAISRYAYPLVEKATLFQAQMDWRGKDAPLGTVGAEPFGTQTLRPTGAGLHPFTQRMLEGFRKPTIG